MSYNILYLIKQLFIGELKKSGWKRAARTDKGVHAISNVVNCKLAIKRHFIDEFKEESEEIIKATNKESTKNERLSKVTFKNQINWNKIINTLNSNMANIKIFGIFFNKLKNIYYSHIAIRRVTKKFDSKNSARCRFYEYLIPISVFKKPSEKTDCSEEFDNKILEKINIITKKFIGSKNFHNYSRKMKAKDPKSWRIIIEFEARILKIQDLMTEEKISEYKTESLKDMKYLVFKIIGQSFIYHQIRKMIGSLIQYFQKDLPEIFFENAFSNDIVKIWLAPAEGLFLNRVENLNF